MQQTIIAGRYEYRLNGRPSPIAETWARTDLDGGAWRLAADLDALQQPGLHLYQETKGTVDSRGRLQRLTIDLQHPFGLAQGAYVCLEDGVEATISTAGLAQVRHLINLPPGYFVLPHPAAFKALPFAGCGAAAEPVTGYWIDIYGSATSPPTLKGVGAPYQRRVLGEEEIDLPVGRARALHGVLSWQGEAAGEEHVWFAPDLTCLQARLHRGEQEWTIALAECRRAD